MYLGRVGVSKLYHFNVFLEKFSDLPSTVIVASYCQLPEVTLWNANNWKSESILKRNPEISIAFRKLFQGTVKKSALWWLSLNSSGSLKRTSYLIFSDLMCFSVVAICARSLMMSSSFCFNSLFTAHISIAPHITIIINQVLAKNEQHVVHHL